MAPVKPERRDACDSWQCRVAGPALACLLIAPAPATAADPQGYAVSFSGSGNRELDNALRDSSALNVLRRSAPTNPFALILRARKDVELLRPVLEGFGYYGARIDITVEGRPVEDDGLVAVLEAVPAGKDVAVRVAITPGALYHWREIVVDGELPGSARGVLGLKPGTPAVAGDALAARTRLLTTLQQQGYAFAKVELPVAWVDATDPVIDLHFPLSAGEPVNLGAIDVQGLVRTHPGIVRGRMNLQPGIRYDPRRLDAARRALLALGVFSRVTVRIADAPSAAGDLPVTFDLAERKRHAVRLTAEYSTDLGGKTGATWTDRNLFGNAEQLQVTANALNLGGSATRALGYDARIELLRPDATHVDRSWHYSAAVLKQSLQAYDVQSATLGTQFDRRLSTWWTGSVGANLKRARIDQQGQTYLYTLLSLPVAVQYDSTRRENLLQDPVRGLRGNLALTPAESLDTPRRTFVYLQGTAATFFDLSRGASSGRSVLALRVLAGNAFGAGQFSLPPDQRFYGGGSATVRGYAYQSIGPAFADGSPAGGTTVAAATAELRQRFGRNFGAAVFVDTGQVTATRQPFNGTWSVGAGVGLRYYTVIGPIRLDVAMPVGAPAGAARFQVYIGLGQAF
jgi:translocation and assembly module TamA